MTQTHEGAIRGTARRLGIPIEEWDRRVDAGEKWCTACKCWHMRDAFGKDATRYDGLSSTCLEKKRGLSRALYQPIPKWLHRPRGPTRVPRRDGDKSQARSRIWHDINIGLRPHPNTLPCFDCGHVWKRGERRHEYDHYLGYAAEHHYDVQSVCTLCHSHRDNPRTRATACPNGHAYPENARRQANGARFCIACRRARDRARGPARRLEAKGLKTRAV
jgi:hypothetical protein